MYRRMMTDSGDSRSVAAAPGTKTAVYWRLLPFLRPHARRIALGLALLLVSIPASNFHPLVWAFIVDRVIGQRRVDLLLPAVGVMFAVQALSTVLDAWRSNMMEKVGQLD